MATIKYGSAGWNMGKTVVSKKFVGFLTKAKPVKKMDGVLLVPSAKKIVVGRKYQVCVCSGLDSDRIGTVVPFPGEVTLREHEPGRYKPFDARKEAVLRDDDGRLFSMFKDRLLEVK